MIRAKDGCAPRTIIGCTPSNCPLLHYMHSSRVSERTWIERHARRSTRKPSMIQTMCLLGIGDEADLMKFESERARLHLYDLRVGLQNYNLLFSMEKLVTIENTSINVSSALLEGRHTWTWKYRQKWYMCSSMWKDRRGLRFVV